MFCRSCGTAFEAHYHNAMYCEECRALRRKQSSKEAWQRKKVKVEREKRGSDYKTRLFELEYHHMIEMGMQYGKYGIWKETHPKEYDDWLSEQIKSGLLPPKSKQNHATNY